MIFTVTFTERVERVVEVEVEAPSATVAKDRALELYADNIDCGTLLSESSSVNPNDMIVESELDE